MARHKLTFENIGKFEGGTVVVAYDKDLAALVRDCRDRPHDKSPRKLTLEVVIIPKNPEGMDETAGGYIDVDAQFKIKISYPARKTAMRPFATNAQGQLTFNDMSPDNPHQMTIDNDE